MASYTTDAKVSVFPFTRQREAEETVIGRPETSVFLVLPHDAVEILDELASGKTVGEAQASYQQKYGEIPDMEDLLGYLESKGFLGPWRQGDEAGFQPPPDGAPARVRFHFTNIPQSFARAIFNPRTVAACGVLIALGLAALIAEPALFPGWRDLFFRQHMSAITLTVIALYYLSIFIHEMSHLLAARAAGVSSRMGISHRLWMLVAETDISGLWSVPKNERYLPLLAGSLVDATSASILLILLFAQSHHWLALWPPLATVARAMLLVYFLSLSWQCFFFVRTDFYYAIATFFGCKNLLKDTEAFLRNRAARLLPFIKTVDQSQIPLAERRVIRSYAVIWILGRIAALAILVFIHIPLMINYFRLIASTLAGGYHGHADAYLDTLIMASFVSLPLAVGFWLWIRSLTKAAR
jgi:putative peptide zinc metalloprotease protein